MARNQIERLDYAHRSWMRYLRTDQEVGSCFSSGFYFRFYESCRRKATALTRTVADVIRPPDDFFGSYATAASFMPADVRLACVVIAGIAGLATLILLGLLGWSEIGAGTVSATERRADPSSSVAVAPRVETQDERIEAIRRRGLALLRADFPEDEPSPSSARADRLEFRDATIKPVMRIATAGGVDGGVAAPAPLPAPAASKPAEAKEKHAVKERRAHRAHARRASRLHRDRVRVAHAKYVQVAGEPQITSADGLQPDRASPEENNNKASGWAKRLQDAISWKGGRAKGNGGGGLSCSPSADSAMVCTREANAGQQ
jgi:hypothetical protein